MYLPAGRTAGTRSPGVVIIHGGGWSDGSSKGGRVFEIGTTLAKAGYVCARVAYRAAKYDRWPTNVYDCKNAVRFLRRNAAAYGIDAGHLARSAIVRLRTSNINPIPIDAPTESSSTSVNFGVRPSTNLW